MLSSDRRNVVCDMPGCGKEAVGGCEERINAGHGGDRITIAGDLVAWCGSHEQELLQKVGDECRPLDLEQLRAACISQSNKRGRSM
jgi:hypothetical protein